MPIISSWALHETMFIKTYGAFTNNFVERHNRTLKTLGSSHTSLPSFLRAVLAHHRQKQLKLVQDVCEIKLTTRAVTCNTRSDVVSAQLAVVSAKTTVKAFDLLNDQVDRMQQHAETTEVSFANDQVCYKDIKGVLKTYPCDNNSCGCLFFKNRDLPCWHMLTWRLLFDQPLFHGIPEKWLIQTLLDCSTTELRTEAAVAVTVVPKPKKKKVRDEGEKRTEATDIWKKVLNSMVACGNEQFEERCKLLMEIEKTWRVGREVHRVELFPDREQCEEEFVQVVFRKVEGIDEDSIAGGSIVENCEDVQEVKERVEVEFRKVDEEIEESNVEMCVASGSGVQHKKILVGFQNNEHTYSKPTTFGSEQLSRPCFKFSKAIKRKGRPKGTGQTSKKVSKKGKATKLQQQSVPNSVEKPDSDVDSMHDMGFCGETEEEYGRELIVGDRIINLVCQICKQESVPSAICNEGQEFCEMIMCSICSLWFHEICATGSAKVTRGMQFECSECCQ